MPCLGLGTWVGSRLQALGESTGLIDSRRVSDDGMHDGRPAAPSRSSSFMTRISTLEGLADMPYHLGLDIGGTLAKIAVSSTDDESDMRACGCFRAHPHLTFTATLDLPDGKDADLRDSLRRMHNAGQPATLALQFYDIASDQLQENVGLLNTGQLRESALKEPTGLRRIATSGGGAHKFAQIRCRDLKRGCRIHAL